MEPIYRRRRRNHDNLVEIDRIMMKIIASLLLLFLACTPLSAEIPLVSANELESGKQYEKAAEIIRHIIDVYHYRKKPLDDELSNQIFDNYLKSLDQNHSFFIQSDIDEFEKYRERLDNALQRPDLSPAFEIFKRLLHSFLPTHFWLPT